MTRCAWSSSNCSSRRQHTSPLSIQIHVSHCTHSPYRDMTTNSPTSPPMALPYPPSPCLGRRPPRKARGQDNTKIQTNRQGKFHTSGIPIQQKHTTNLASPARRRIHIKMGRTPGSRICQISCPSPQNNTRETRRKRSRRRRRWPRC